MVYFFVKHTDTRITAVREKLEKIQNSMANQKETQLGNVRARLSFLELNSKTALESRNELLNFLNSQVLILD